MAFTPDEYYAYSLIILMMIMIIMGIIIDVHLGDDQHKHYTAGSFLDRDKDLMMKNSIIILIGLIQNSNERLQDEIKVHFFVKLS